MKIYHNPRCTKSRQTLALLQENGVELEVVEYLKDLFTTERFERVDWVFRNRAFSVSA